ncbi:cation transporter [Methylopila sp. 73B]|uniref:heavy-metal-associated domain-containing protein n=1 Tax=Methylopila sp. 73B TaxID=1120792 RepID=UPI00035DE5AF|nr:cation transporter [Methylopila sp. 73B]
MIVLDVSGMTCDGCSKSVQSALSARDPDAVVVVNRMAGRVSADTTLSAEEAIAAIEAAGYDAQLAVTG